MISHQPLMIIFVHQQLNILRDSRQTAQSHAANIAKPRQFSLAVPAAFAQALNIARKHLSVKLLGVTARKTSIIQTDRHQRDQIFAKAAPPDNRPVNQRNIILAMQQIAPERVNMTQCARQISQGPTVPRPIAPDPFNLGFGIHRQTAPRQRVFQPIIQPRKGIRQPLDNRAVPVVSQPFIDRQTRQIRAIQAAQTNGHFAIIRQRPVRLASPKVLHPNPAGIAKIFQPINPRRGEGIRRQPIQHARPIDFVFALPIVRRAWIFPRPLIKNFQDDRPRPMRGRLPLKTKKGRAAHRAAKPAINRRPRPGSNHSRRIPQSPPRQRSQPFCGDVSQSLVQNDPTQSMPR